MVEEARDHVVIVAPFDDSPAQKAGLHAGQVILKVNGDDMTGMAVELVVSRILGPAGTNVTLTIFDPKTSKTFDVTLTRARIAITPTPMIEAPNLARLLGGPRIFIKRDDMTGLAFGGNKARKLAYLVGEAIAAGAGTLVTAGAAQSNHARMTAAAARAAGLDCHLVLAGTGDRSGNALLDVILGAEIHWAGEAPWDELNKRVEQLSAELASEGQLPYPIPMGGATPVGCLGYVDAADELAAQCAGAGIAHATVVFASGTGGTHAGLLAGISAIAGENRDRARLALHAIAVAQPADLPAAVAHLAMRASALMGSDRAWSAADAPTDDRFWGGSYGESTAGSLAAIRLFASTEGILLDPVYTGKAADGLIEMCHSGELGDHPVVFLHTGGAPALFADAYSREFII